MQHNHIHNVSYLTATAIAQFTKFYASWFEYYYLTLLLLPHIGVNFSMNGIFDICKVYRGVRIPESFRPRPEPEKETRLDLNPKYRVPVHSYWSDTCFVEHLSLEYLVYILHELLLSTEMTAVSYFFHVSPNHTNKRHAYVLIGHAVSLIIIRTTCS